VSYIKIKIVPIGEVPKKFLEDVREELKVPFHMLGDIAVVEKLPKSAFNGVRKQYRSDLLLDFLEKNYQGRIIGITKEDTYTEGLNFVFGQAKVRGRVAVVSIARLDPTFFHSPADEGLLERRAIKEVIHEVGHMLGLTHCNKKGCVMNFSNTIADVDRKTKDLCEMCNLQLGLLTSNQK
jgi:archaemetzincin